MIMKKTDLDLLYNDLCGRLPYDTIIEVHGKYEDREKYARIMTLETSNINYIFDPEKTVIVYLRPLLSMTEEEKREFYDKFVVNGIYFSDFKKIFENHFTSLLTSFEHFWHAVEWLNSKHFDYRGLIEKGIALPAEDDMYE